MLGEVPTSDVWNFKVVNSNFEKFKNVEAYRTNDDFIKIAGNENYNSVFTSIKPIKYQYKELVEIDEGYHDNKPQFITEETWDAFFEEYKVYICNYDKQTGTFIERRFYDDLGTGWNLHDLFFNYQPTGEKTEDGQDILVNQAMFAEYGGFYWVRTKEELGWCADQVNGEIDGIRGDTFKNKFAIVLGDDIGTYDVDNKTSNIETVIGKYPDRPFEGLLFGNGFAFHSINLICRNEINGIVGVLGKHGKIHYVTIDGNCKITCKKPINLTHLKASSSDIEVGILCGRNYGQIHACEMVGTVEANDFIPAVYTVQKKSDLKSDSGSNPVENAYYPDFMCINSPGNIIPYCGYFNEGVFASETYVEYAEYTLPSSYEYVTCDHCGGTLLEGFCIICSGTGKWIDVDGNETECNNCKGTGIRQSVWCKKCGGTGTVPADPETNSLAHTCWECHGSGVSHDYLCEDCGGYGWLVGKYAGDKGAVGSDCPTCSGTGRCRCKECSETPGKKRVPVVAEIYSAAAVKNWSKIDDANLDNSNVMLINTSSTTQEEFIDALRNKQRINTFITYYDYSLIEKTADLAGISRYNRTGSQKYTPTVNIDDSAISPTDDILKVYEINNDAPEYSSFLLSNVQTNMLRDLNILPSAADVPIPYLDVSMKLDQQARAAYYISPLVGMNKASIINSYVDAEFSSSGTFVGFFGGIAGKQCGGIIDNVTVNLKALENEKRNVFTTDTNEILPDNSGLMISINDTITYNPMEIIRKNIPVYFSDNNYIWKRKLEQIAEVVINDKEDKDFSRHIKYPNSISIGNEVKIPLFNGFNISFSGCNANNIYKHTIDFKTKELYETYKDENICTPNFNDDIKSANNYYFANENDRITITSYTANSNIILNNYLNGQDEPIVYEDETITDKDTGDITTVKSTWWEQRSSTQKIYWDEYEDNYYVGSAPYIILRSGTVKILNEYSILNICKITIDGSWERTSDNGIIYYKNNETLIIPVSSIIVKTDISRKYEQDSIDKSLDEDEFRQPIEVTNNIVTETLNYMTLNVKTEKNKTQIFYINNIIIPPGKLVLAEESIVETDNLNEKSKYGIINIKSISDITLKGVYQDSANYKRHDYAIHIPSFDPESKVNFIDKCSCDVDLVNRKVLYSDKFTRNSTKDEILNSNLGIFKLIGDENYSEVSSDKINKILRYKYYEVNYNDVKNYHIQLNSIRNIGGLFGSLVVTNDQIIRNSNASLVNEQGIKFISAKTRCAVMLTPDEDSRGKIALTYYAVEDSPIQSKFKLKPDVIEHSDFALAEFNTVHEDKFIEHFSNIVLGVYLYVQGYGGFNSSEVIIDGTQSNIYYDSTLIKQINEIANKQCYTVEANKLYAILVKKSSSLVDVRNGEYQFDLDDPDSVFFYKIPTYELSIDKKGDYNIPFVKWSVLQKAYKQKYNKDLPEDFVDLYDCDTIMSDWKKSTNQKEKEYAFVYCLGADDVPINRLAVLWKSQSSVYDSKYNKYIRSWIAVNKCVPTSELDDKNDYNDITCSFRQMFGFFGKSYRENLEDELAIIYDSNDPKSYCYSKIICKRNNKDYTPYEEILCDAEYEAEKYVESNNITEFTVNVEETIKNSSNGYSDPKLTVEWTDYALLNRYGSIAAICEYNTTTMTDKVNYMDPFETQLQNRPVKFINNHFGYFENNISTDNYAICGPQYLCDGTKAMLRGTAKALYGLGSPLIAEFKPTMLSVPSIIKYNNGVTTTLDNCGLPRDPVYTGLFTCDYGLRTNDHDPFGWVNDLNLDVPGINGFINSNPIQYDLMYSQFIIPTSYTNNIYFNPDMKYIPALLFDWTTTYLDPGSRLTGTNPLTKIDIPRMASVDYYTYTNTYGTNKKLTDLIKAPNIKHDRFTADNDKYRSKIFKYSKQNPKYAYFGSSLMLYRDDLCEFMALPGFNHIRNGAYYYCYDDCENSDLLPDNKPVITELINFDRTAKKFNKQIWIPRYVRDINLIKEMSMFTYTYDTFEMPEFSAFNKQINFDEHNSKIGYWFKDSIDTGGTNDYITYSGNDVLTYNGNILTMGYTKLPATIRREIIENDISITSGISGEDVQGLLIQDSKGNNVMYLDMSLGDCNGLQTWAYSAYPSSESTGCSGLLVEVN